MLDTEGENLVEIGKDVYFNATIIEHPNFREIATSADYICGFKLNGTVSRKDDGEYKLHLGNFPSIPINSTLDEKLHSGQSRIYFSHETILSYFAAYTNDDIPDLTLSFDATPYLNIIHPDLL
jgi:hypothetical protein